ncbi:cob(I)yrinic acid a,c-diamide adenosyltransferase [Fusibacter tunisiensis]|uniref:Cob(I)alamin adenosyltransferase n=1 Tax=Fusibacter tunisiensis TaxID=1008308 RepID=A0ABS2MP83_9FIRM|nr:cob(I)yrinic acid a,c-diamide adenosyltransferase [Fusibacter tunisiensis]MBM7561208.1 cob(I)alamin adenosyltransferase [Fusibacter tunisiensis]
MEKGFIHVYTGNGKGKTTAAFGLAVRALCAGKTVYIGQFVKDMKYSETGLENYFEGLSIEQLGQGCFIETPPGPDDKVAAEEGLKRVADLLETGTYDVVILDEIFIALLYKLIDESRVLSVLEKRHPSVEVVLTGRYAPQSILDVADLVTEMQAVKHYYEQGVLSRKGIDC